MCGEQEGGGGIMISSLTTLCIIGLFATLSINDIQHNSIERYYAESRFLLC